MKKIIKWVGIVLGALLALVVLIVLVGYVLGGVRMNRTYDVPEEAISVPTGSESLELGQHWAAVYCVECHGEDLGGTAFFDDPIIGTINGSNLTTGEGGASAEMSDAEIARAIRHAVDHGGRGLMIMPSRGYFYLSDEDLGDIIAYLKNVPPVDKEWGEPEVSFVGHVLIGLGVFGNVSAAELIDHSALQPESPVPGVTVDYGRYLAQVGDCAACHGADLSGGKSPDPASPPGPNLTPGGHLGEWAEIDFIQAMRTGVEPDGEEISSQFMPWKGTGQMTNDELRALWVYLQSLPALEDKVKEAE
jgi:mono/diheme cytochrome c family protein